MNGSSVIRTITRGYRCDTKHLDSHRHWRVESYAVLFRAIGDDLSRGGTSGRRRDAERTFDDATAGRRARRAALARPCVGGATVWPKHRAFTIVVALTLGLAIGGNAAIYSVVSGVLLEAAAVSGSRAARARLRSAPTLRRRAADAGRLSRRSASDTPIFANIAGFFREGHEFQRLRGAGESRRAVRERRLLRAARRAGRAGPHVHAQTTSGPALPIA